MAGETDTPLNGGTESATLTQNDTSSSDEFFDPFNTDNDEIIGENGTESEIPEDETPEPETAEKEDPEGDEETADDEPDEETGKADEPKAEGDDVVVTMADGQKVELGELKKGYLRQADYSRKTIEVANSRNAVSEQADRIGRVVDVFADYLAKQLPPQPGMELAYENPTAYYAQKAQYDASLARLNELISIADASKGVNAEVGKGKQQEQLAEENRKLAEIMPMTTNPKGREQFFSSTLKAGQVVGYSEAEIRNVTDHRLLALGYWAAKGIEADKAKEAAKAKIAKAPPVATPQRRQQTNTGASENYSRHITNAARTGSVDDVLKARLARLR